MVFVIVLVELNDNVEDYASASDREDSPAEHV